MEITKTIIDECINELITEQEISDFMFDGDETTTKNLAATMVLIEGAHELGDKLKEVLDE